MTKHKYAITTLGFYRRLNIPKRLHFLMNSELDYDGTGATAGPTTTAREVRYTRSYRAPLDDKYEQQKSCFVVLTSAHGDLREAEVAISSAGVRGE